MKKFVTIGIKANGENVLVNDSSVPLDKQLKYVNKLKGGAETDFIECGVFVDGLKRFVKVKKAVEVMTEEVKEKKK
jgi:hypothetical protein